MATTPSPADPAGAASMTEEADIGSGEKSPGQRETEKIIESVPELPDDGDQTGRAQGRDGARAPGTQPK
ncbi:hypothetical protein KY495_23850 [Massilia sp. PAMC28688]|uniref:hypothetical protein n=1 Tax=Massilia sp. PAMC28688 TaxID=2861283 RepID=UPI001C626550|nr:hypothetical protein [Massilia sp. PAMC28688]QYF93648.1 hypothetical protein KY495_23850 [Massilia sp. PAMC28688]